jgi:penicillin-binding protein 1C
MWDVSGTSGAAPVWAELMGFLHRNEPSRAPSPPAGLVQAHVRFGNDLEATRTEWFIAGTEQAVFSLAPDAPVAESAPRITSPSSGTIIALDPDIPPDRQRVRFEAEGRGVLWRIDGKPFMRGSHALWLPWPGRHVVELIDARGQVVDQIRLEVRGAGVVAHAKR